MNPYYYNYNMNDERYFPVFPFALGALTGGVAVAAFNPYRPRPYYPINNTNNMPYGPPGGYPYYRPY